MRLTDTPVRKLCSITVASNLKRTRDFWQSEAVGQNPYYCAVIAYVPNIRCVVQTMRATVGILPDSGALSVLGHPLARMAIANILLPEGCRFESYLSAFHRVTDF